MAAEELIAHFDENPPKGEMVLMVSPPEEIDREKIDTDALLREKLGLIPLKTAVKEVVELTGMNKNDVYAQALKIKNENL